MITLTQKLVYSQLTRGGQPIQEPLKLVAGTKLEDLDFVVEDENESPLELDSEWFVGAGPRGYRASWVSGDVVLPVSQRPLPPYQVC